MPQHMVIFQNPQGEPGYNQFESIDEAVSFVEKIRNEQGIDSIRIFELEEVKFDLKPYYKVELLALKAGAPAPAPSAPAAPAAAAPAPAAPAPQPEPAAAPEPASPFASPAPQPEPPSGYAPPSGGPVPPTPPADQPEDEPHPTRRGLFGR